MSEFSVLSSMATGTIDHAAQQLFHLSHGSGLELKLASNCSARGMPIS